MTAAPGMSLLPHEVPPAPGPLADLAAALRALLPRLDTPRTRLRPPTLADFPAWADLLAIAIGCLQGAMFAGEFRDRRIDLLGVTMAGSASLGHFVMLQRTVRKSGGQIIFCNVDLSVAESFRISKLDSLFLFVPDRPAALALAASLDEGLDTGEARKVDPAPEPPPVNGPSRNPPGDGLLRGRRRRKL